MNKSQIKNIRKDMNAALEKVTEKHGVAFEIGTIRFDRFGFSVSVKAVKLDGDESTDQESIDRAKFERDVARSFDVSPDLFHQTFEYGGDSYKIVGYKPRSRKYPIVAENQNGTRYKFPKTVISLCEVES